MPSINTNQGPRCCGCLSIPTFWKESCRCLKSLIYESVNWYSHWTILTFCTQTLKFSLTILQIKSSSIIDSKWCYLGIKMFRWELSSFNVFGDSCLFFLAWVDDWCQFSSFWGLIIASYFRYPLSNQTSLIGGQKLHVLLMDCQRSRWLYCSESFRDFDLGVLQRWNKRRFPRRGKIFIKFFFLQKSEKSFCCCS